MFTYATSNVGYVEQISDNYVIEGQDNKVLVEQENQNNTIILEELANIVDTPIEGEYDKYSLIYGKQLSENNIIYKSSNEEDDIEKEFIELDEAENIQFSETDIIEINTLSSNDIQTQKHYLFNINNPDTSYIEVPVVLDESQRSLLERLVQGESGGLDIESAALVAQCIRDAMVYKGYTDINKIIVELKYSGSTKKEPTEATKEAVRLIFDEGKSAVQHRIIYFYAPKVVDSRFHESQNFIIEYGGHRFFDEK